MKLNVLNQRIERWEKKTKKEIKRIRHVLVLREKFIRHASLDLDSVRYNWDINTRKVMYQQISQLGSW